MGLVASACGGGGSGGDAGPTFGADHPRIYLGPNKDRLTAALTAGTPEATRFKTMVDRWVGGADVYAFAAWNAALVGQLTGDPKYCAAAIADVDKVVMTAEQAIAAGNKPAVAADDYLQIGDQLGDLALVYDWCHSAIPSDRATAWLAFANQAVFNVWHPDQAVWGGTPMSWSGWAVDDPSDNYYYSFNRATMLLGLAEKGDDPAGDTWITQFHDTKILGELVPTFERDLVGGGSREGTGYGTSQADLFELYDIWQASTGEDLASKTSHTRASMLWFTHAMLPTLDRFAPTGDQSRDSTASFFDYQRHYLQVLVTLFPSDPIAPRVQALLAGSSLPQMSEQFMYAYDFLHPKSDVTATMLDGMGTAYFGSGTGQLFARSGWDAHATWVNLIAGPYTQSHAHQDQGALMIYKDGWLAYDPVIDSHSGLPQTVDAHGTVRIVNGSANVAQKLGNVSQMLALHSGTGWLHAAADLTPVYGTQSSVQKVQREIVYLEPSCIVVYDRVVTAPGAQQVWQLAFPSQPQINGTQTQVTASGHMLNIERITPTSGPTASVYSYASGSDFSGGYRLDETLAGGDQRWLHVIWIDTAVTSITTHDANTVDIVLAGGTPATVSFDPTGVGGTLTLNGAAVTLGAGVDKLPE